MFRLQSFEAHHTIVSRQQNVTINFFPDLSFVTLVFTSAFPSGRKHLLWNISWTSSAFLILKSAFTPFSFNIWSLPVFLWDSLVLLTGPTSVLTLNEHKLSLTWLMSFCVPDEGIYNTYVLDSDSTFGLLLHCAEKSKSSRYLSSLVLSRTEVPKPNVISYLREKLPQYDIDLEYMFPIRQTDCSQAVNSTLGNISNKKGSKKHPLKHAHDSNASN